VHEKEKEEVKYTEIEIKENKGKKEVKEFMLPKVSNLKLTNMEKVKARDIYYFSGLKGGIGLTNFLLNVAKQLSQKYKVVYVDMNASHVGDALIFLRIKKKEYLVK